MVLWDASLDAADPVSLLLSNRILDLHRDVVASAPDLKGSTYLVTRAWANQIEKDCQERGDWFSIVNPNARWR